MPALLDKTVAAVSSVPAASASAVVDSAASAAVTITKGTGKWGEWTGGYNGATGSVAAYKRMGKGDGLTGLPSEAGTFGSVSAHNSRPLLGCIPRELLKL